MFKLFVGLFWTFSLYAVTPTTTTGDAVATCDQELLAKLAAKGFMTKNVCYGFNLKENNLKVVFNGVIYDLGAYSLDGTLKPYATIDLPIKSSCEQRKPTKVGTMTEQQKKSLEQLNGSLKKVGGLISGLGKGIKEPINVKVTGFADGVRLKMAEFDNASLCTEGSDYKNALCLSTPAQWITVSTLRNQELALFRAKLHMDELKKNIEGLTNLVTTEEGINSPTLENGMPDCKGFCKYRRGALIDIKIPGLVGKLTAPIQKEVEIQFISASNYALLEAKSTKMPDLREQIMKNIIAQCPEIKTSLGSIITVASFASWARQDTLKGSYKKKELGEIPSYNLLATRKCLVSDAMSQLYHGITNSEADINASMNEYASHQDFLAKNSETTSFTISDLKIYFTLMLERYVAQQNGSYPMKVEDVSAYMFNNIPTLMTKHALNVISYETSLEAKYRKLTRTIFTPVPVEAETIIYDTGKFTQKGASWKKMRGFFHTACGSGVAISNVTGFDSSFGYRSYHLKPGRDRHSAAIGTGSDTLTGDEGTSNKVISRLYDTYKSFEGGDSISKKLLWSNVYSLQHPTSYLIKQECSTLITKTPEELATLIDGATALNFSTGFTPGTGKDGFPKKIISGVKSLTGGQVSCLVNLPVMVAHVAGGGAGETDDPPEMIAPPADADCKALVAIVDKIPSTETVAETEVTNILNFCKTFSTKFPWSESECQTCKVAMSCEIASQIDKGDKQFCD